MRIICSVVTALSLVLLQTTAFGQTSTRPVTIVVAHPAGGGTDLVARVFAQKLTEQTGRQVIVENKPGASGTIGTDFVARAAPDGHTLMVIPDTNAIVPALFPKLNSDIVADFAPISLLAVGSHVLVAHPSFPANNLQALIEYVRKNPGEPYASAGNGTAQHLGMELLKSMAGIDMRHIPYKGGGQAITDVVGGQVKVALLGLAPTLPFINTGKLKAIAVTGDRRSPALPAVPTVAESGVPGFSTLQWFAVVAPAATPAPMLQRYHDDFVKAARDPAVIEKLASAVGLEVRTSVSPEDLTAFLKQELRKWPPIVKAAQVKMD